MVSADPQQGEVSTPINRIRWATRRVTGQDGIRKRDSVIRRWHHKRAASAEKKATGQKRSSTTETTDTAGTDTQSQNVEDPLDGEVENRRRVFFNVPLPDDVRDEDGKPITQFARNKIRTAKYTPLSFLPKNLWFQFHNIANIYFLFIIILGFFGIFGAANPGLNAVPLIFILTVTAVKDAIEDWRRTVLDAELNNSPVHRLVGFNNVNTAEEEISIWRKTKKGTSKWIKNVYLFWKNRKAPKSEKRKSFADRALEESRPSVETEMRSMSSPRFSFHSARSRRSAADDIQMTPVPSPVPGQNHEEEEKTDAIDYASDPTPFGDSTAAASPEPGSVRDGAKKNVRPLAKAIPNLVNPRREAVGESRFKKDFWKNVQVGDYVRLYDGEEVPSDVAVMCTSDTDGACYIETKNLDGETNLKVRQALRCGRSIKHARDCERAEFIIESEGPQANLYSFNGVIKWTQYDPRLPDAPGQARAEPITINQILPRGSTVRNTDWILGVVLFTGRETKIMLNAGITPSKRAKISRDLNWNVIYNFIILFFMCFIAGTVQGINFGKGHNSLNYFEPHPYSTSAAVNGFVTFWAAIILVQNLVPVSLYITLEIIRTLQAVFIYSDVAMYYEKLDYPCTPKSWNISDDLGQIEYIFSDKTGTLTQNVMEFKKATINGIPYGEAYTEALAGLQRRQGIDVEVEGARARKQIVEDKRLMLEKLRSLYDNPYLHDDNLTFIAPDLAADLSGRSGDDQRSASEQFLLALALCHTVISERIPGDIPSVEFKAQSPDEAALVSTARDCGFTVLGRTDDGLVVNVLGEDRNYTIMNTLEFNSSRKRMSAIVRMPDGKIILFCKGADSMVYSRLKSGEQTELRKTTAEHLEMFAREGLRTLCIAQRELDETEYQAWNREHEIASSAIADRDDKLDKVADTIERDLTLLGGTAIEDKLQDGVPDAIQLLGQAGIKLWVLTGDKVETAINIGFSCNLLNNDMDLIIFKSEDEDLEKLESELDQNLATFNMTGSDAELKAAQTNHEPPAPTHALIIDGDTLKLALHDSVKQKFLLLCKQCKSVLCCRVSPSQKAAVVELVKNGLDCLTLAIGDGANDVAMIQEAHVGVGIAGVEGRQAVMSSDYAIGQFRFLTRLLLVHGRWSYRRLAETIANFFYKNLVWTFALYWYQIYNNFDCTYLYDYTYIILFNLAFTSLPVILMGVLDQDVDDKVSLAVPQLYRRGIERKEWTQPKFWVYMFDGLYQSVLIYFSAYCLFSSSRFESSNGLNIDDTNRMGVYVAGTAVLVANTYILFNTYRWDWLTLLIVCISTLLFWFWTGVWTAFTNANFFYKAAPQVFGQLSFWALLLVVTIICLIPRFVIKSAQKIYFPRDVDIIREQVAQGKFDYLNESDSLIPVNPEKVRTLDSSSDSSQAQRRRAESHVTDDMRPIYPPSTTQTATTHARPNGSDGTEYTGHGETSTTRPRPSADLGRASLGSRPEGAGGLGRPSFDRSRTSFDRTRASMDRVRPSYEQSPDFTSAALLTRLESSNSGYKFNRKSTVPEE